MCGILGIIHQQIDPSKIAHALGSLAQRGPDNKALYFDNNLALGHTRLAIQDISDAANQPMISDDENFAIVFNGEIYNHQEIRADLIKKGHRFHTSSDTETLLKGYIEYGAKLLPLLNGIFAFAIYNKSEKSMFLSRDQFGVKPLYYYQSNDCFVFSSQIKTIQLLHNIPKIINKNALFQSNILQWTLGEQTVFSAIKKLAQGHSLSINLEDSTSLKIEKWASELFEGKYVQQSEAEWIQQLEAALIKTVERQLLSDKPIAYFLSGGLDSSLLVAIARKIAPHKPIKAFTIDAGKSFAAEGFSGDLTYGKIAAAHLNIDLEIIEANPNMIDEFDNMIWELEEPQADFAPILVRQIAARAKQQGYDVLMSGAGADDVFSGYRRHQAIRLENSIAATPFLLRKMLKNLSNILPTNSQTRRFLKIANSLDKSSQERLFHYFFWAKKETVLQLFSEAAKAEIDPDCIEKYFAAMLAAIPNEYSLLNQMLQLEMNTFLPNHNLNYTDKMGMAASVEIRVPYLDKELVALAAKIPPELKMKGITTKYLLRKVAEKYLPEAIINRPKTGFGAPLRSWLQNDSSFQEKISIRLSRLAQNPIFDSKAIEKLYQNTILQKADHSYTLLALLAIESWLRQFTNIKN